MAGELFGLNEGGTVLKQLRHVRVPPRSVKVCNAFLRLVRNPSPLEILLDHEPGAALGKLRKQRFGLVTTTNAMLLARKLSSLRVRRQAIYSRCMGKVIVFANTKGGVGKSFLAVHLAVWLADCHYRVAVVDCDDQKTSSRWISRIPDLAVTIRAVKASDETSRADEVRKLINSLKGRNDFVIVDTKGSAGLTTSAAVIKSDLAFIPLQPSASDIWPIENALSVIRLSQEVRNGQPAASLIMNQTDDSDVLARDVRRLAGKFEIPVAKTNVKRLHAYRDAPGNRTVATRLTDARGRKAGIRLATLFTEILSCHLSDHQEVANG